MARYPEPCRTDADQLWEAICEGRRLDAYDLLQQVVLGETFQSLETMRRINPDRVAPITDKDRAS